MRKGTIILVRFPLTDFTSSKRRPALIISDSRETDSDVIVAFISSVLTTRKPDTDVLISDKDKDFKKSGLKKSSLIRVDKIMTLEKSLITGELGTLADDKLKSVDEKLKSVLGL